MRWDELLYEIRELDVVDLMWLAAALACAEKLRRYKPSAEAKDLFRRIARLSRKKRRELMRIVANVAKERKEMAWVWLRYEPCDYARDPKGAVVKNKVSLPGATREALLAAQPEVLTKVICARALRIDVEKLDRWLKARYRRWQMWCRGELKCWPL